MSRNQLNIRVSDELAELIDMKRIELAPALKMIPTRSDLVRYALESYLGVALGQSEIDRRTTAGRAATGTTRRTAKKQS